jgi:diguanylate cyclase (GGDEF)-like protein/PAS domain S-box-containing protein
MQKEVYENLLESIADPFFIIDEKGTYIDVFGGTERSLYDDAYLLKGRNIHDFTPQQFATFFMTYVHQALQSDSLTVFEYQLETSLIEGTTKNGPGGMQWFEARIYPLNQKFGEYRAVTALILNISERKHLQHQLRELSYQDAMTKVANRRYFFERFSEQLEHYAIDKVPLAILLLDVDHYKRINDTYGHLAGDKVLQELVFLIRQEIPKESLLARFGGDEFVISIEQKPFEEVKKLAKGLRQKIANHSFFYNGQTLPVTVSIGATEVTVFDTDTTSVIGRADIALYKAKAGGRNKEIFG